MRITVLNNMEIIRALVVTCVEVLQVAFVFIETLQVKTELAQVLQLPHQRNIKRSIIYVLVDICCICFYRLQNRRQRKLKEIVDTIVIPNQNGDACLHLHDFTNFLLGSLRKRSGSLSKTISLRRWTHHETELLNFGFLGLVYSEFNGRLITCTKSKAAIDCTSPP